MHPRTPRIAVIIACSLTTAIALAVLVGWAFHIPQLRRFVPGFVSMNPISAMTLMIASAALFFRASDGAEATRDRVGRFLAALALAIGAARLLAIVGGPNAGMDRWLFADQVSAGAEPPTRIALRTAISFVLSGGALLLINVRTRRGRRPSEALSAIVIIIAALALVGYSYGLFLYYRAPDFVPMSLPGAIGFLILATGILLARPNEGVMAFITSDTAGGLLMRLLLPLGVILPVLLGALRIAGENAGWYASRAGVALFATAFIILFLASVSWTARLLFRSEMRRHQAEERVRRLNVELEQRVIARTEELNQANAELRLASKTKDDFLAALSHELRSPLTPVLISATSLENDDSLSLELREQMSMMRQNVELEARLIDDLLDLTRITRGKLELQIAPADMHALLTHTEQIVRSEAAGKGVQLRFALEATEHRVNGDAARLHQVFWNLVKNAIKFTPPGGKIDIVTTNPSPGNFRLIVRDTGVGIAPSLLNSVFLPFVQAESDPGRGGLGLGLSISKTIIDLHGGTMSVSSAGVGHGCTFTIDLTTMAVSTSAEGLTTPPATSVSGASYRLLLVEDHRPTLETLARLLRKRGHHVLTAATVEAALALASPGFDLVISDIGLPDGTGVDLMVELARRHGLRGIAISGYGMDEDVARTRHAGFLAHLVKPIDFERLHRVIEQVAAAA